MKAKLLWSLGLALLLSSAASRATNTVRAFGLEFTVISNAVMTINSEYASLRVEQTNAPDCGGAGTGSNEVVHVPFGVSVHLGEAQSGVYIYPDDAGCRENEMSMWGNAYGSVNGETNRLISSIKGTRVEWGEYRIEVDVTPLGATSYTYQVWSHGIRTMHATNQDAYSHISTLTIEDYGPRVNPFFLSEAGPGAIIEFPNGTYFSISGSSGVGDRIIIIAEGATNQVNYVSQVDVFGSANLPAFAISDARIGMFGRPHKALGGVNFTALNGRLTAGPFEGVSTNNGPTNGVLVDFKQNAVRWVVQTEPFALEHPSAQLLLSAVGFAASSDSFFSAYGGPVGLTKSNGVLNIHADLSGLGTSNVVLRVFQSNALSGAIYGASGTVLATLAATNPLVTGWAVTTQAISISIAESTRVTGPDGTTLDGDHFEFAPHESPFRIQYISSVPVLAEGIRGVTIVSELTEELRLPEPRIRIERVPTGLMVSWPYLSGLYGVVRTNLTWEPIASLYGEYRDFRSYVVINPTNAMQFFSLRHYYWYYSRP